MNALATSRPDPSPWKIPPRPKSNGGRTSPDGRTGRRYPADRLTNLRKDIKMSRRIIATEYISLDGVIEDPVGMEGSGLGDWTGPFSRGADGDKFKLEELMEADALLFGRLTYDGFAAVWPLLNDSFAERMNGLPKYVASRTLTKASWNNTAIIGS